MAAKKAAKTFNGILKEMGALFDAKAQDYGTDEDALANLRESADFGIEPWVYAAARINEKIFRLKNAAQGKKLSCETAQESFKDIAVFGGIGLQLLREEEED